MKEIGEFLKDIRKENGVTIEEVSEDLDLEIEAIENVEAGNTRAFKDMYELKELIKEYAKYLGADVNYIMDEFNDFLFERTSKISINDIEGIKQIDDEKKIISPYTKIPKPKKDYSKIVKYVLALLVAILIITVIINSFRHDKEIDRELIAKEEVIILL